MFATIRRFQGAGRTDDELIPEGRRLAVAVSKESGFIAYALLEAGDGGLVAITVFEERSGLARADLLVDRWGTAHGLVPVAGPSEVQGGEVIVQRGI